MARVGIYAGTFDPVHAGHIAFAREALRLRKLDEVVFLPERLPRGKLQVTDVAMRCKQLERAVAGIPGLRVLLLDQPCFTVDETLPLLHQLFDDAELTLLVGSDVVAKSLSQWPHIAELLSRVSLTIGIRNYDDPEALEQVIQAIQPSSVSKTMYIHTDYPHLSSSQLR